MNKNCICHSNRTYENCCERFLVQGMHPQTAEELMRSRYAAFATGNVDYILDTEKLPVKNTRKMLQDACANTTWVKLEVLGIEKGGRNDTEGRVLFTATSFEQGQIHQMTEKSQFRKINNRWYYVGAITIN